MKRDLLPKGTIISYCDHIAVVVEDYGSSLTVECEGDTMRWYWTFEGVDCVVVSQPEA